MAKSGIVTVSPAMLAALRARDPATLTQGQSYIKGTNTPVGTPVAAPGGGLFTTRNLLLGAAGLTAFLLWRRSHKR